MHLAFRLRSRKCGLYLLVIIALILAMSACLRMAERRPCRVQSILCVCCAGKYLIQKHSNQCLARDSAAADTGVSVVACKLNDDLQEWDFGRVNRTIWQVRDAANSNSCLTYNSTSLHMELCQKESGDKLTPNQSGCADGGCRFSGIIYQLWYLNSYGQFTSAITNIGNHGSSLLPFPLPNFPPNTPWCLATIANTASSPPPPPEVDISMPLQVWSGPLAGGDIAVVLLNIGNGTKSMTLNWADIGLDKQQTVHATNLWTNKSTSHRGSFVAAVAEHDCIALRLSPK